MENAIKMCDQFCEEVDKLLAENNAEKDTLTRIEALAVLTTDAFGNSCLDHDCGGFEEGCQFCWNKFNKV